MKTRHNTLFTMTFAVLLSLLTGGMLTGCATTGITTQDTASYDGMKQVNDQWQKERAEDPALNVKLPDMTAEEYEALGDRYRNKKDYAMAFVQYEKSLALDPDNQRVQYKQGMLRKWESLPPVFMTSSLKKSGRDELLKFIGETLQ